MVSYGRQDRKVEQNKPQNVWARHQASQREDWEELHSPEGTEEGREEEAEGVWSVLDATPLVAGP